MRPFDEILDAVAAPEADVDPIPTGTSGSSSMSQTNVFVLWLVSTSSGPRSPLNSLVTGWPS